MASLIMLSPSRIAMRRGSSPSPFVTEVAAMASGGEMMAPNKKETNQLISGMMERATNVTKNVVSNTSTIAARLIDLL